MTTPPSEPGYPPPAYGYYPPPGYLPYGQPYPGMPKAGTNGFAIASMVLGIVWIYGVGSILALVFGYIARSQIKRNPQGGDGMAIAGIVLGWVGLVGIVVFFIVIATAIGNHTFVLLPGL
jgi:hypothetical protein